MNDGDAPADAGVMDDIFSPDRDRSGNDAPPEGSDGQPRDEFGRFAPKDAAAEEQAEAQEGQPPAQPPPSSEQDEPDRNANRHVPLSELLEERKKFQERLDAEVRARDQYWQNQLQQFQQPQPRQGHQPPPDFFEDPDGAFFQRIAPITSQFDNFRLDMSEDRARERYGDDLVNEAMQAAQRGGFLREFASQRHPYGALVEWFQREKTLAEVGTDPAAFRKQVEEEVRKKVLEELRAGGTGAVAPQGQSQPRFPGTLADQTHAGGPTGQAPPSREAVMNDIFAPDRDRRAF